MMNRREKLIYIAGMLDAKSCFYICKYYCKKLNVYKYAGSVQLWVPKKEIGDFICETLNIQSPLRKTYKGDSMGMVFNNKSLDALLEIITPYLVFKKPHAKVLIKYRETINNRLAIRMTAGISGVPPHIEEIRDNYFQEIRQLNGFPAEEK